MNQKSDENKSSNIVYNKFNFNCIRFKIISEFAQIKVSRRLFNH